MNCHLLTLPERTILYLGTIKAAKKNQYAEYPKMEQEIKSPTAKEETSGVVICVFLDNRIILFSRACLMALYG